MEVLSIIAICISAMSLGLAFGSWLLNFRKSIHDRQLKLFDILAECEVLMSHSYAACSELARFFDSNRAMYLNGYPRRLRYADPAAELLNQELRQWGCDYYFAQSMKAAYALHPYLMGGRGRFGEPNIFVENGSAHLWEPVHHQKQLWAKWELILHLLRGWFGNFDKLEMNLHQKDFARRCVKMTLPFCVVHWLKNCSMHIPSSADGLVISQEDFDRFVNQSGEMYKWQVYCTMAELAELEMRPIRELILELFRVQLPEIQVVRSLQ